ncbi:branched-chain amino acid ABC transporter permease [Variovorax sp. RA8]|uniref:branched-chain amino acid ABC transporter permease n=1 Tax=Variovorax sp. (strain JCM 16519 / RA8) TaxID=662548 RepID=UPI0013181F5E|nr:branched-chain amino acid ABC transporter permease [Variovorax sp. RA8]VTU26882.1 leucine/isoleucine/valine transporter permease subunit [Variovorax sp. RA8]
MTSLSRVFGVGLAVLLLAGVPLLLSQGLVNAAIQMLIAALFASAYNVLCGQAGMLSFGHAAYFGVGAFATVHAMNALGGTGLLPTPLLPLAGALGGLAIGAIAGWFATQRTGTYFAMITLAIAELLHALAPHLKGLFGGEAGISSMRMPSLGITFGSTTQVYYLTLAWVLVSLALLYVYTLTPVGRLALGLRENGHRLRFLGYDVHRLSVLVFSISAMFSGIAGGLQVISNEAANYVVLDAQLSAAVVLNTYIGGVKVFLGPALGASLMTFFGYAVSDLTQSWLLYQGTLFVLVMLFMPEGLAGLFRASSQLRRQIGVARLLPVLLAWVAAAALLAAGTAFAVELLQRMFSQDYRALAGADPGAPWPAIALFGRSWLPSDALTWAVPAALLACGGALVYGVRRGVEALQGAGGRGIGTAAPGAEVAL